MKVKKNAKYAVACLSSMGLRITPENRMAVHNSNRFLLQATSAETNVLNVTSSLGPECLVMTRFVEGSPMAAFTKAQLRARNIAFVGPDVPQGGPWASATSSTSRTPASAFARRACGTTAPARWAARSTRRTTTLRRSSARTASPSCTSPDSSPR